MKSISQFILIISAMSLFSIANSQCVLTAIKPPEQFTTDQLWNLIIVNNSEADLFKLTLRIKENNKTIYEADTRNFPINTPTLTISYGNKSDIEPIIIKSISKDLNNSLTKSAGLFPSGNYKVEFDLLSVNKRGSEVLCNTSYVINVDEFISPLKLLYVHNEDTIRDACPTFGWVAPVPAPKGEYYYELVLTECYDGQQPGDATTENLPLYKMSAGSFTAKNVCGEVAKLEKGKTYAWKVNIVQSGLTYAGENIRGSNNAYSSSSWRFYYEGEDSVPIFEPDYYFIMDENIYASYVSIDSNMLPIKFNEDYNVIDSIVEINLYDSIMNVFATDEDILLAYNDGTNMTYLNFCEYDFELPKGVYVLEINCINNKKYFIRFKNRSEPGACY